MVPMYPVVCGGVAALKGWGVAKHITFRKEGTHEDF